MPRTALPLLLVAAVAMPTARADQGAEQAPISVTRVSGGAVRAAAWTGVADGDLLLRTVEGETTVPVADVIEISLGVTPDPPRSPAAQDVRVDLWSGEAVAGRIVSGDDYGISLRNALMGVVRIEIDAIAGLRFPLRLSGAAERPDLRTPDSSDVVHLVGGDRIECTIAALGESSLRCATDASDELEVPYDRVTAVRLMPTGEAPSAEGAFTAVLRDGSRVRGTDPRVDAGRLVLAGVSGFEASAALADVVSVLVESDTFRYLSDLPRATVDVQPFWEPVAGDPAAIYAPRMDRAFSGGLLRAGGRTWLKGIGAFSGTSMTWDLGGEWSELRTQVAVDDAAGRLGAVVFVIEVDGEERWRSDLVVPAAGGTAAGGVTGPVDAGRISVAGGSTLVLRVLAGDAENPYPIQDEADWLGAMLIR